eukprot:1709653-Amphidinium_carterae.1
MSDSLEEEAIFETAQEEQHEHTGDNNLKVIEEGGPATTLPPCASPKREEDDEPTTGLPSSTTTPTVETAAVDGATTPAVVEAAVVTVAPSDVIPCAEQTSGLADDPQVLDRQREQDLLAKLTQNVEPFLTGATAAEAQEIMRVMATRRVRVQTGITWLYKHLQEIGVSSPEPRIVGHLCATALIAKSSQRSTIAAILQRAMGNKEWSDAEKVLKTHAMVSLIQDELWMAWADMRGATAKKKYSLAWRCVLAVAEVPVTNEPSESSPNTAVASENHDQWKSQPQSHSSGDSWNQWWPEGSWKQSESGKRQWSESSHWSDWDWKQGNDTCHRGWAEKKYRWHSQDEQQEWRDEAEDDSASRDTGVATSCVEEFTVLDAIHCHPTPPPWRVKVNDGLPSPPPVAIKPSPPPWAPQAKPAVAAPPPPVIPPAAQAVTLPIPPGA